MSSPVYWSFTYLTGMVYGYLISEFGCFRLFFCPLPSPSNKEALDARGEPISTLIIEYKLIFQGAVSRDPDQSLPGLAHYQVLVHTYKSYCSAATLLFKGSLQEIQRFNCWKTATSRPNAPNIKLLASITKSSRHFKMTFYVQWKFWKISIAQIEIKILNYVA